MTRGPVAERREVSPSNNIYTALTGVALLVVIIGLVIVILQAKFVFGGNGLGLF